IPGGEVPASNYPSSDLVHSFQRDFAEHEVELEGKDFGKYSVDARLLNITINNLPYVGIEAIERWSIEIKASEPNGNPATSIAAIIEVGSPPFFNYAIKADQAISLKQFSLVDSYDSRMGAYGGANISTEPASLGSNGTIELQQFVTVKGDA